MIGDWLFARTTAHFGGEPHSAFSYPRVICSTRGIFRPNHVLAAAPLTMAGPETCNFMACMLFRASRSWHTKTVVQSPRARHILTTGMPNATPLRPARHQSPFTFHFSPSPSTFRRRQLDKASNRHQDDHKNQLLDQDVSLEFTPTIGRPWFCSRVTN